jgi:PleD family two-component response regulator
MVAMTVRSYVEHFRANKHWAVAGRVQGHIHTCEARPMHSIELVMPVRQERDPVVFIVDDNVHVRNGLSALLESIGIRCETFKSTNDFLYRKRADEVTCLILDIRLPGTGASIFRIN